MSAVYEDINQLIDQFTSNVIDLIPKLGLALVVLVAGLLIAWLAFYLIKRLILYLERNINFKIRNKFLAVDLKSSAVLIARTFFWVIVALTLAVITQILGFTVINTWLEQLVQYLPNVIAVVAIILFGVVAGKLVGDLVGTATQRTGFSNGMVVGKFVRHVVLFISIIIAIDQLGVEIVFLTDLLTTVLATMLFGAALAFGLGAKTSVSNILGSYYLQKTYHEGSVVRVGDIEGVIIKITPTAVLIETQDGQVMVPAKDFNEKVTILIRKN